MRPLEGGCDVLIIASNCDVLNSLLDNVLCDQFWCTIFTVLLFNHFISFCGVWNADRVSSEAETTVAQAPDFPFPIDADDHCESPLEAYQDLSPLLTQVCGNVKTCASMRIYDPYYCDGAVIRNLSQVGFLNVYNRKKDCYAVWALSNAPDFDVLVTNPPYSDDHIEKLVRYITSDSFGKRPWFLLLPQWVHKKNFYVTATSHIRPFYLVPRKRYVYLPPKNFRQSKKSDVHKKSSPFVSMWYCWGGAMNDALIQKYSKDKLRDDSSCDLARSKSALRDLRRKPQR